MTWVKFGSIDNGKKQVFFFQGGGSETLSTQAVEEGSIGGVATRYKKAGSITNVLGRKLAASDNRQFERGE